MNRTTLVAASAATAIAASLALAAPAAADNGCPAGQMPLSGTCHESTFYPIQSGHPAPGTGGLIFRDKNGNDLGSGMGESDRFTLTGSASTIDGIKYIEVEQTTRGHGGWGSLYRGYVKAQYAIIGS